ncbi:porin [Vibrio maritimus]|uniref:porin n=1 Tax=Vibrio maritimus TaxID=990268 RepID=UPI003734CC8E
MKKTLVALSVLAAAGSAQAIELYNQDKVTVNMTGDVEVRYVKGKADGSELTQQINDADFGFDTRYQVNDDLQVGAYWEFSGTEDNKVSPANTGDVYMALYSNTAGSIKFGKLATQIDDAGIGSDYIFGISSFVSDADLSFEEAIRYDIDKGSVYGGLGFVQNKTEHFGDGIGKDARIFDAKLGGRVADFDITGYYATIDLDTANDFKTDLFALELRYGGVENLNIEAGYYYNKDKTNAGSTTDSTYGLAADYTIEMWKVAAGVDYQDYDGDQDSQTNWFLNAGYALAPSTTAYIEVGGDNAKDSELGYGIGLKAEF